MSTDEFLKKKHAAIIDKAILGLFETINPKTKQECAELMLLLGELTSLILHKLTESSLALVPIHVEHVEERVYLRLPEMKDDEKIDITVYMQRLEEKVGA